jgi:hypothetical protein
MVGSPRLIWVSNLLGFLLDIIFLSIVSINSEGGLLCLTSLIELVEDLQQVLQNVFDSYTKLLNKAMMI